VANVDEKLRRGFDLVQRAGSDNDLLGAALLAFHSALADHLDAELRRSSLVTVEERQAIDEGTMGWATRATLAQRAGIITDRQRDRVLDVNRVRAGFAHGETFTGSARSVAAYGELVAELCGRSAPVDARVAGATVQGAASGSRIAGARQAATVETAPGLGARAAVRRARKADLIPESTSLRVVMAAVAVLLLAVVAILGLQQLTPSAASLAGAAPTALVAPATRAPTSTPMSRSARIVNLPPGAPGWLRTTPSFRAPTQPVPLSEGLEVTLLDRDPVDAEGTRWRFVTFGGYDGWCPEHNLEIGR